MPDELIELRASEYQDLWPSCSYGIVTWCSNYDRGIIQYPQNIIKMHTCTVDMAITVQYHSYVGKKMKIVPQELHFPSSIKKKK